MQDILYDLLHDAPMQTCVTGRDHTMGEDGTRHVFDIIGDGVVASRYGSVGLSSAVESKGAARTDAEFDGVMVARGAYQFNDIVFNAGFDTHATNDFLQTL